MPADAGKVRTLLTAHPPGSLDPHRMRVRMKQTRHVLSACALFDCLCAHSPTPKSSRSLKWRRSSTVTAQLRCATFAPVKLRFSSRPATPRPFERRLKTTVMGIKEERGEVWRADRVQGPWRESAHEPTVAGIYVKWDTNLQTPEQAATAPKPSPEENPKSGSKASLSSGRSMGYSADSELRPTGCAVLEYSVGRERAVTYCCTAPSACDV